MSKQIRFWTYSPHGEAIKIKLREGQKVWHHFYAPTDEGFTSETNQWTFDGERVFCEWYTNGRDCDGRLEQFGETFFFADEVKGGHHDLDEGIKFPRWRELAHSQRDHTAEAMGY
jgi:hypothetical protein